MQRRDEPGQVLDLTGTGSFHSFAVCSFFNREREFLSFFGS